MQTTDLTEALATARVDIARLEVQVTHLSTSVAGLQESNQQLTLKLDQVLLTLSEARGGWKTLMVVGGAASTVGAALSWLIQHLPKG
jgi:predicted secreted protein